MKLLNEYVNWMCMLVLLKPDLFVTFELKSRNEKEKMKKNAPRSKPRNHKMLAVTSVFVSVVLFLFVCKIYEFTNRKQPKKVVLSTHPKNKSLRSTEFYLLFGFRWVLLPSPFYACRIFNTKQSDIWKWIFHIEI